MIILFNEQRSMNGVHNGIHNPISKCVQITMVFKFSLERLKMLSPIQSGIFLVAFKSAKQSGEHQLDAFRKRDAPKRCLKKKKLEKKNEFEDVPHSTEDDNFIPFHDWLQTQRIPMQ